MKTKATHAVPPHLRKIISKRRQSVAEQMQNVYPELRKMAAHLFQNEKPGHTLQPTALVHEAFLRLCRNSPEKYENEAHFFGIVARAMRQILVEHARKRGAGKRGGGWRRVMLEDAEGAPAIEFDLLTLDNELRRLEAFDQELCRIAEMRFFRRALDAGDCGKSQPRRKHDPARLEHR